MEKTNAELAEKLRWLADYLHDELGWIANETSPHDLRFATQRLEALSQVTEEEVEGGIHASCDIYGDACRYPKCGCNEIPRIVRVALEAARKART